MGNKSGKKKAQEEVDQAWPKERVRRRVEEDTRLYGRGLRTLHLSGRYLPYLPHAVARATDLQQLWVNMNDLRELPWDICRLQGLTLLVARGNSLSHLPDSICQLSRLQHLDVSSNKLQQLPQDIGHLRGLTRLEAWGNELTRLPDSMCQLKQLQRLDLGQNRLQQVPSCIWDLSYLTQLSLSENKLTSLPEEIHCLTRLGELYLNHNQLTQIPDSLVQLSWLERLYLHHNRLSELPTCIGGLSSLRELLADTATTRTLPQHLRGRFYQEGETRWEGQEAQKLVAYYKEIIRTGEVSVNKVRVLILGDTLAGKTSLVQSLLTQQPHLTTTRDRTIMVEQHLLKLPHGLELQIIDLGGQEVYNFTHKMWVTEKAQPLIVFDIHRYIESSCSDDMFERMMRCWIMFLTSSLPGSRPILAASHMDECTQNEEEIDKVLQYVLQKLKLERKQTLEELEGQKTKLDTCCKKHTELQHQSQVCEYSSYSPDMIRRYQENLTRATEALLLLPASMVEIHRVSSKTYSGIRKLQHHLVETCSNEDMYPAYTVPRSLMDVEKILQNPTSQSDVLSMQLRDVKDLIKVPTGIDPEQDPKRFEYALTFLKNTGDILWYNKNQHLKDMIFPHPARVIGALQTIVSHDLDTIFSYNRINFQKGFKDIDEFQDAKKNVQPQGRVSVKLMRALWADRFDEEQVNGILLLLLELDFCYALFTKGKAGSFKDDSEFLFPCFLGTNKPQTISTLWLSPLDTDQVDLQLEYWFPIQCPVTLRERIMVHLHRLQRVTDREDWRGGSQIVVGEHVILMEADHKVISLRARGPQDRSWSMWFTLVAIHSMIKALLREWAGTTCEAYIMCPTCTQQGSAPPGRFLAELMLAPPARARCFPHRHRWVEGITFPHRDVLEITDPYDCRLLPPLLATGNKLHMRLEKLSREYAQDIVVAIIIREIKVTHNSIQDWLKAKRKKLFKAAGGMGGLGERHLEHLYPKQGVSPIQTFAFSDLTTLVFIVRSSSLLPCPTGPKGWKVTDPDPTDLSMSADLFRLRNIRNYIAHESSLSLTQAEFAQKWDEAEEVLLRLGGDKHQMDVIKASRLW